MIGHLEVALVLVDDVLLPRVVELDEGQVALRLLADGLVDGLVVADPLQEVDDGLVGLHALVVVPQKVASELHPKVRNHGEGPY